ncbi:MAG: (d)CMP kinase [Rikenellaceae bacterium]
MRDLIIAIDGYSSCGKSTFAKAIAAKLGYIFIDTGAMYRAVTLAALRAGVVEVATESVDREGLKALLPQLDVRFVFNSARGASDVYLSEECVEGLIRTMEVSRAVSIVSAVEEVREKLVSLQQQMGHRGGVVMDGRDIGSVVFPDAEIKIFMVADPCVRAKRRYDELLQKGGEEITLDQIVESVVARDRADETRSISPLVRADDAVVLDNSDMSVEAQMEWFDRLYQSRVK